MSVGTQGRRLLIDSTVVIALLLAATWLVGGFVVAVFMKRAGRDFRLWLLLGLLLGPFGGLLAPDDGPAPGRRRLTESDEFRSGDLDVLAGIDGSVESVAAINAAVELLDDRISSLSLARVLDYETAGPRSGMPAQAEAFEAVSRLSDEIDFHPVNIELLFGSPGPALISFAENQGFELIVVGARGKGMTRALFGSVASELVGHSPIPVLVGPRFEPTERDETGSGRKL